MRSCDISDITIVLRMGTVVDYTNINSNAENSKNQKWQYYPPSHFLNVKCAAESYFRFSMYEVVRRSLLTKAELSVLFLFSNQIDQFIYLRLPVHGVSILHFQHKNCQFIQHRLPVNRISELVRYN